MAEEKNKEAVEEENKVEEVNKSEEDDVYADQANQKNQIDDQSKEETPVETSQENAEYLSDEDKVYD